MIVRLVDGPVKPRGRRVLWNLGAGSNVQNLKLVATRGEAPQLATAAINTEAQLRKGFRTRHYFGGQDVTGHFRVLFCNYYCQALLGEQVPGNTCDVEFQIEIVGAPKPVVRGRFSSGTLYTMTNGEGLIQSDSIQPSDFGLSVILANTEFWCLHERTVPLGGIHVGSHLVSNPAITGEAAYQCAPQYSQMGSSGAISTSGNFTAYSYRNVPLGFIGRTAAPEIAVLGIGDSIVYRVSDTPGDGQNGAGGWFQRGLASVNSRHVPYVNLASPSEQARMLAENYGGSRRKLLYKYATHAIVDYGTNDLSGSRTPTQVRDNLRTIWAGLAAAGVRVEQMLLLPKTTSTDSWVTSANQTPVTGFALAGNRDTVNTQIASDVSAGTFFVAATLDFAADVSDIVTPDPNKWANSATTDGVHPAAGTIHGTMATRFTSRVATWTA